MSRRRKSRLPDARYRVVCLSDGGDPETHEVVKFKNSYVFRNHPGLLPQSMAAAGVISGQNKGCFYWAMVLATHVDTDTIGIPTPITTALKKRRERVERRATFGVDPCLSPAHVRKIHCLPVIDKIMEAFTRTGYRKPKSQAALRLVVVPTTAVALPRLEHPTRQRGSKTIKVLGTIHLHVRLARWARVALDGVAVVERMLVLEILSSHMNRKIVLIAKQSRGCSLVAKRADIRFGSDRVWRVHEWL